MLISWRIGPFTTTIAAPELDVLPRAEISDAASARITGKYSGFAPDITALTATFSTVYSHSPRLAVGCILPTTSCGEWLVRASIAATRSSVGRTIGRPSV